MYGCSRKHIYKCMIHFPGWPRWLLHQRYSPGVERSFCTRARELILAAAKRPRRFGRTCLPVADPPVSLLCSTYSSVSALWFTKAHGWTRRLLAWALVDLSWGLIASRNNEVQGTGHSCEQILPIKRCISAQAEVRCLIGSFHHGLKGLIGWHTERWMGQLSQWRVCVYVCVFEGE